MNSSKPRRCCTPSRSPAGTRVAIVTNAGGAGVLAADACAEAGLSLPPLTPSVVESLSAVLPDGATAGNPVDVTAAVTEEQLGDCVDRIMRHPGIDAVLLALVPTAVAAATGNDLVRALTSGPAHRALPVAVVRLEQDLPVRLLPASRRAARFPRTPNPVRQHVRWPTPLTARPG